MFGNEYQEISLENQEKTESIFEQKISAPDGKIACLDFRFKSLLKVLNNLNQKELVPYNISRFRGAQFVSPGLASLVL